MLTRFLQESEMKQDVAGNLKMISYLLLKHWGQKAILLIDEYNVLLDKAYHRGYYDEIVALLRSMFAAALKSNASSYFAVLTGCLRVLKENIFTVLNNLKVLSIVAPRFDEQYGFTDEEVRRLLADYGLADHFAETKEWYDGYRFGDTDVYCSWDIINHVDLLCHDNKSKPAAYWINTSSNELVKDFVEDADKDHPG